MKRVLSIFMALAIVLSVSACTSKNGANSSSSVTSTQQTTKKAKIRIAYGNSNNQWPTGTNENDNAYIKWLREKSGVDIEVVLLPNEDPDSKINMLAAVGDIPDIIKFANQSNFFRYVNEGTVKPIEDKLNNYPNIIKRIPDVAWDSVKITDKRYGVPSLLASYGPNLPFFRSDWLNNLGLKQPNTLDEYFATAKAFTENDPDKNNKADTIGFTFGAELNGMDVFFGAYGVPRLYGMRGSWEVKDGKLSYTGIWDENKDALLWFQKLYQSGYLDKEFLTNTDKIFKEKLTNGYAGLSATNPKDVYNVKTPLEALNPKAIIDVNDNLTKPTVAGKPAKYGTPYVVQAYLGITNNVDSCLKVIDTLASDDAMANIWAGEKDSTWKQVTNYKGNPAMEWIQPNSTNSAYRWNLYGLVSVAVEDWYMLPPYNVAKEAEWRFTRVYDVAKKQLVDKSIPYSITKFVSAPTPSMVSSSVQLWDLEKNMIVQIISGAKPISEFDNFVKEWKSRGGDKITQEVNDAYQQNSKK